MLRIPVVGGQNRDAIRVAAELPEQPWLDLSGDISDRLIDDLVAIGEPDQVAIG